MKLTKRSHFCPLLKHSPKTNRSVERRGERGRLHFCGVPARDDSALQLAALTRNGRRPRLLSFAPSRLCVTATILACLLTIAGPLLAQPAGPLAFDSLHKITTVRFGQTNAVVSFSITNLSAAPVIIRDVSLSCGCSAASLPAKPWTLKPGDHGKLTVTTDLRGKRGSLVKTAIVYASSGTRVLTYQVNIQEASAPEERARNQSLAKADRQAVFRGDCARCHADATRGRTGKELFAAACAICHEAEHRASMVPDLKAFKQPATRDYWLQWISHGKPDGLMPAFASKFGGPLTDAQIQSLVEFLSPPGRRTPH